MLGLHGAAGEGTDWRAERIFIAQQFPGWTLEYIDGLSWQDLCDVREVLAAKNQGERDRMKQGR